MHANWPVGASGPETGITAPFMWTGHWQCRCILITKKFALSQMWWRDGPRCGRGEQSWCTCSAVTKAVLNKGRSMHAYINDVLQLICWKAAAYNFELHAVHIPGIPDSISWLHEPGQKERLACLLSYWHHSCLPPSHIAAQMSQSSYHFLCPHVQQQS